MSHTVFISYSSRDQAVADRVVAALESRGVPCWIASRDIIAGDDWGEAIVTAISASRAMVLVLSAQANLSPQVKREAERAVHNRVPIVLFRIEPVEPSHALEYFASGHHWLNAFDPAPDAYFEKLADDVTSLLCLPARGPAGPKPPPGGAAAAGLRTDDPPGAGKDEGPTDRDKGPAPAAGPATPPSPPPDVGQLGAIGGRRRTNAAVVGHRLRRRPTGHAAPGGRRAVAGRPRFEAKVRTLGCAITLGLTFSAAVVVTGLILHRPASALAPAFTLVAREPVSGAFDTRTPIQRGRWKCVRVRQSGTPAGSAATLAEQAGGRTVDHFVICNGDGAADGEIQATVRWNRQEPAPGARGEELDPDCIGICLIGDFDKSYPTPAQFDRLSQLLTAFQERLGIDADRIFVGDSSNTPQTGRYFPREALRRALRAEE